VVIFELYQFKQTNDIYICYIKYVTCVLAVRDNALDMGNIKDVLSEAAKVIQHSEPAPGVRAAGDLWGGMCYEV